jgi:hypothetical protein
VSRATIHGRNMSVNFFGFFFRFSFIVFALYGFKAPFPQVPQF